MEVSHFTQICPFAADQWYILFGDLVEPDDILLALAHNNDSFFNKGKIFVFITVYYTIVSSLAKCGTELVALILINNFLFSVDSGGGVG